MTSRRVLRRWQLYAMLVLPVAYLAIFNYWPMIGIQIAFRSYNPAGGMWGSPWVGVANFETFMNSYLFWPVIKNTLVLHFYALVATFPLPIILALALNYVKRRWFSRVVQMITYAPHFIPTVVVVGILFAILDPNSGIYVLALEKLGVPVPDFLSDPLWFRHVYVWSGAWQTMGFSAIVYLAALAGIDPELHEAATVDGASRIRRVWHIDLPGIAPVAIILLILSMGSTLSTGFEKVLLMQNALNLDSSQVIDTYVYQVGLGSQVPQFSYGAAIGVFQSVVGLVLIVAANRIARWMTDSSLW
ncbi:ABC transporter permease [Tenggerimyces flavus]|uniref:ABC transporter permease n=1 Tax=Tenggerimyces flavus TaxID=1708749 RepID=A0ABV7YL15_9ACTN|nr:ABC transporter permease subunit [Tenggerimyces flavus]MBM7789656.1 multiple sugar transport system permease protein/putative aldouronate transport system permease protein [Tenggerimyces flavus]